MLTERELRPRRAPVKYQESDDDDDDAPHDDDYDPHDDDDDDADDPELTDLRATQAHNTTQRARWAEASRRYRATHRAQRAEAQKRYRARHRERLAEAQKRYREQHRDRITEKNKHYWKANREWLMERQQRYRESHREELREKQRQRDARRRELLREQNRIRRARFRAKKRMKKLMALGPLTLTIPLVREAHPELLREKMRTREKLKALGPLRLTIPLTDCLKSMSVTAYVKAFCDSLDSVDTNVPPAESFLQLLEEEECPTLLYLDSGTMQVSEPSDCDDLSFLQDLLSPDEWEQVMDDVQESVFDLEALVPPQGINDWLEDMTSSDEGVDLMYDLVS